MNVTLQLYTPLIKPNRNENFFIQALVCFHILTKKGTYSILTKMSENQCKANRVF